MHFYEHWFCCCRSFCVRIFKGQLHKNIAFLNEQLITIVKEYTIIYIVRFPGLWGSSLYREWRILFDLTL